MAFISHSFRVKHLNGTSGCPHYGGFQGTLTPSPFNAPPATPRNLPHAAERDSDIKCATNGCRGKGTRACHVIMANQNSNSGVRTLVYCCATCNGQKKGEINDIRANAEAYLLDGKGGNELCDCGYL